jgi:hypothetical protein
MQASAKDLGAVFSEIANADVVTYCGSDNSVFFVAYDGNTFDTQSQDGNNTCASGVGGGYDYVTGVMHDTFRGTDNPGHLNIDEIQVRDRAASADPGAGQGAGLGCSAPWPGVTRYQERLVSGRRAVLMNAMRGGTLFRGTVPAAMVIVPVTLLVAAPITASVATLMTATWFDSLGPVSPPVTVACTCLPSGVMPY